MMEETIGDTILEAARRGDLDTIRNILREPAVVELVADMNSDYHSAYMSALGYTSPFFAFRYLPRSDCWLKLVLFNLPVQQTHIFEWFLGAEADRIMGDSVRSLLDLLFCQVVRSDVSLQLTEAILKSHLYLSMSMMEMEYALSFMVQGAFQMASPALVRLLVAHGASLVNTTNLIAWCVNEGDGSTAQVLVGSGVSVVGQQMRVESFSNRTADAVRVLLASGAGIQFNKDDFGSLHEAAQRASTQFVELFVTEGFVDVNAQGYEDLTPLMSVFMGVNGKYETFSVLSTLLNHGALVNLRNSRGRTALHYTVNSTYSEVMPFLLEKGADPNAQDTFMETPLHCVARLLDRDHEFDFTAALDALLSHDANPNIRNTDGETPLDMLLESERGREYVKRHPEYFTNKQEAAGVME